MIEPRTQPAPADVAAHYDELDTFYLDVWGEHLHHGLWRTGDESVEEAVGAMIELVADRAGVGSGDRVVDVGMGYGGTARILARDRGAVVTGLTLSARQRDHAASVDPDRENPTYLLGDWLQNELPDESVDAVVSIECIGHVADKARFFQEARRVLVPGGRLALTAWLAGADPPRWQVRSLLEPICREGRLGGLPTALELAGFAQDAGLTVEGVETLARQVRRTWSVVARRVFVRLLSDRRYLRFLFRRTARERRFALTLLRMVPAYRLGALDYGLLWARKRV